MKTVLSILVLFFYSQLFSQKTVFPEHLKKTNIAKLQSGDSLTYYQCHVDSASQEITLSNGKKINSKKKRITLTEKFVIHKVDSVFTCKYFNSSIISYPNKKFPYLTLTEVKNWEFELKQTKALTDEEVELIAALETKTHAIVHFELNINKTCPNELIIMGKNVNEQFIIEGNYLLSKSLGCL